MADFELAIPIVLDNEGGYVNDPDDPGGETNWGISKRAHPEINIEFLTKEQAEAIYQRDYWQYDEVESQMVANKLLDMAVNLGIKRTHGMLQKVLDSPAPFGAKFTPEMASMVNAANSVGVHDGLKAQQAAHYDRIIAANPKLARFKNGWLRRIESC